MNQQISTTIVKVFMELSKDVDQSKAIHISGPKSTMTIIDEAGKQEKTTAISLPEIEMFTPSVIASMVGIVIKLPYAKEITWEGAMGIYAINLDSYEFRKTKG